MSQPTDTETSAATPPPEEDRRLPVPERAWQSHGRFQAAARQASRRYVFLRQGFILAIFLALAMIMLMEGNLFQVLNLRSLFPQWQLASIAWVLWPTISLVFLAGMVLFAYAMRAGEHEEWWLLRSAAAEIEREIYLYVTILQDHDGRDDWLLERLAGVRRRVGEERVSELATRFRPRKPPKLPARLLADDYIEERVAKQLGARAREGRRLRRRRGALQLFILAAIGATAIVTATASKSVPGVDAVLALEAIPPEVVSTLEALPSTEGLAQVALVWAVLVPALALGLLTWMEVRRLGSEADRATEVANALHQIRDHWQSLPSFERTGERFYDLVLVTETILWIRFDDAVPAVRRAVNEFLEKGDDLLARVLKLPPASALDEAIRKQAEAGEERIREGGIAAPPDAPDEGRSGVQGSRPHAFVVMPFGRKPAAEGRWIDFDAVYAELVRPALEAAGFEAFRADEEAIAGDILTDMFQELLLADLVLADLSIDNANVFYELGVRHAMRKRGCVHIQCGRSYMPFDIFNVRTLPYRLNASGRPDPRFLNKDIQALAKTARETWASERERVHSPIFSLLNGLREPDRKALSTPLATGYWREYHEWQERVAIARRQKRVGDLLILTEEVKNPLIQEEAIAEVGAALRGLGLDELALRQYRRGLEFNPSNLAFRREEAVHLARLGLSDEAVVKLNRVLEDHPDDVDTLFTLGEIYERLWQGEIAGVAAGAQRLAKAYESAHWLKQALATLLRAYRLDQNHVWVAIKLLLLAEQLEHLGQRNEVTDDPEIDAIRQQLTALHGAVRFTVEGRTGNATSFSELIVAAYFSLIAADGVPGVVRAFKRAAGLAGKNKFYIDFTLERLEFFSALDFRPQQVAAAIEVLREARSRLEAEEAPETEVPRQIFLFAGHAVDREGAQELRFPPEIETEAGECIAKALERLEAQPEDLAITAGAACGGDILFIEACRARGMTVDVYLPCTDARFIEERVAYAGDHWVERFYELRSQGEVRIHHQEQRLGPAPEGEDAFERNNRWALYSSLMHGVDRTRLVALWDGKSTSGTGERDGTADMVERMRRLGGMVDHLNTTTFRQWSGKMRKALEVLTGQFKMSS